VISKPRWERWSGGETRRLPLSRALHPYIWWCPIVTLSTIISIVTGTTIAFKIGRNNKSEVANACIMTSLIANLTLYVSSASATSTTSSKTTSEISSASVLTKSTAKIRIILLIRIVSRWISREIRVLVLIRIGTKLVLIGTILVIWIRGLSQID